MWPLSVSKRSTVSRRTVSVAPAASSLRSAALPGAPPRAEGWRARSAARRSVHRAPSFASDAARAPRVSLECHRLPASCRARWVAVMRPSGKGFAGFRPDWTGAAVDPRTPYSSAVWGRASGRQTHGQCADTASYGHRRNLSVRRIARQASPGSGTAIQSFLAIFDGSARAVRRTSDTHDAVTTPRRPGLRGQHTGHCEGSGLSDTTIRGRRLRAYFDANVYDAVDKGPVSPRSRPSERHSRATDLSR